VKRYKSTTILGGGPPGKIVQCQSFSIRSYDINEILDRKEKEDIELEAKIDAEVEAESDINH
jgi:hypothetical protein